MLHTLGGKLRVQLTGKGLKESDSAGLLIF